MEELSRPDVPHSDEDQRGAIMHLVPYSEFSEFYDLYVGDWMEDLPVYAEHAKRANSSLLEIGAGTGRLTVPLAEQGFSVVAVDSSASMLQTLRKRLEHSIPAVQQRVQTIEMDVRCLALGRQFDLVFLPYYTFNYLLTPIDQRLALDRLGRHLSPAGELMIDVFVPHGRLTHCPAEPVLKLDKPHPETGGRIRAWNTYSFDRDRQIEVRSQRFELTATDGSTRVAEFVTRRRYSFQWELDRQVRQCGFTVDSVVGGYEGRPTAEDSEQLLYVLRGDASIESVQPGETNK
jgi:SAM-dependent methyltransferase